MLTEKQIDWCIKHIPSFEACYEQAEAALKSTEENRKRMASHKERAVSEWTEFNEHEDICAQFGCGLLTREQFAQRLNAIGIAPPVFKDEDDDADR